MSLGGADPAERNSLDGDFQQVERCGRYPPRASGSREGRAAPKGERRTKYTQNPKPRLKLPSFALAAPVPGHCLKAPAPPDSSLARDLPSWVLTNCLFRAGPSMCSTTASPTQRIPQSRSAPAAVVNGCFRRRPRMADQALSVLGISLTVHGE